MWLGWQLGTAGMEEPWKCSQGCRCGAGRARQEQDRLQGQNLGGGAGLVEGFPDLRQFGIFQLCLTQLKATKKSQKTLWAAEPTGPAFHGVMALKSSPELPAPSLSPHQPGRKTFLEERIVQPGTASQGRGESPCPKGLKSFPNLSESVILEIGAPCLGWAVMLSLHMTELNLSLPLTEFILGFSNHLS